MIVYIIQILETLESHESLVDIFAYVSGVIIFFKASNIFTSKSALVLVNLLPISDCNL